MHEIARKMAIKTHEFSRVIREPHARTANSYNAIKTHEKFTKFTLLSAFVFVLGGLNALNALEITSQTGNNWIWTGDYSTDNTGVTGMTEATATDGKVTLDNGKFYNHTAGTFIDTVTVTGGSNGTQAQLKYNKSLDIGTLTLDKFASLTYLGRWGTNKCPDGVCATLNVDNLIINGDGTNGGLISLGFINAKNTTIKGDSTATTQQTLTIKTSVGASHQTDTATQTVTPNLGNVKVENAKIKFETVGDKSQFGSIGTLTLGEKATFDTTTSTTTGTTNQTKDIIENKINKLIIVQGAGDNGNLGLNDVNLTNVNLSFQNSTQDYFNFTPFSVNLGNVTLPSDYYTAEHRVVDDGFIKQSGDSATIIAPDTNGNIIANTAMANYTIAPSDKLQAKLDNGFIARQILLADTLDINSKMMNYRANKTMLGINARGEPLFEQDTRMGEFWVDYDYTRLKDYGDGVLDLNAQAIAFGGGLVDNELTRVGFFARYTHANADSNDISTNSYSANSINAGLYISQMLWDGGYLRGQLSYHNIGVKGDYVLQNTRTGVSTSGTASDSYNFLTTGLGVEQDINYGEIIWANVGADINHIVSLFKDDDSDFGDLQADSLTMFSLSAAVGGKVGDETILYLHGQAGYVLGNVPESVDLSRFAAAVSSGSGGLATASAENHDYNGFVTNIGLGIAHNITDNLQMLFDAANIAYGDFSSSSYRMKFGVDFRF